MVDVFKVADLLVSYAVKAHGEEVDLIGYTGSHARGKATAHSDLDVFYTPAEGKNPPIGYTFLVGGVLFDFWAIPWEKLDHFATGRFGGWAVGPAVVYYAKLLYARSEEQEARFAGVKLKVLDLQKPEARPLMIRRALDEFTNVLAHLGNLRLAVESGAFADVRHAGWKVMGSAWECLALANQTFIDSGRIVENIPRLRATPENLEQLILTISTSAVPAEIAAACERLALDTREILREFQRSVSAPRAVRERFCQAYPEINAMLGKIHAARERNDPIAASAAACFAQCDVSRMLADVSGEGHSDFNHYSEYARLYRDIRLPELMASASGDQAELDEQARLFDDRMRRWLHEQSVGLSEFNTVEEFERSLQSYRDPRR